MSIHPMDSSMHKLVVSTISSKLTSLGVRLKFLRIVVSGFSFLMILNCAGDASSETRTVVCLAKRASRGSHPSFYIRTTPWSNSSTTIEPANMRFIVTTIAILRQCDFICQRNGCPSKASVWRSNFPGIE